MRSNWNFVKTITLAALIGSVALADTTGAVKNSTPAPESSASEAEGLPSWFDKLGAEQNLRDLEVATRIFSEEVEKVRDYLKTKRNVLRAQSALESLSEGLERARDYRRLYRNQVSELFNRYRLLSEDFKEEKKPEHVVLTAMVGDIERIFSRVDQSFPEWKTQKKVSCGLETTGLFLPRLENGKKIGTGGFNTLEGCQRAIAAQSKNLMCSIDTRGYYGAYDITNIGDSDGALSIGSHLWSKLENCTATFNVQKNGLVCGIGETGLEIFKRRETRYSSVANPPAYVWTTGFGLEEKDHQNCYEAIKRSTGTYVCHRFHDTHQRNNTNPGRWYFKYVEVATGSISPRSRETSTYEACQKEIESLE